MVDPKSFCTLIKITEEDDIQDSELKCAERCADIKEDILGRCPCYKSVSQNEISQLRN